MKQRKKIAALALTMSMTAAFSGLCFGSGQETDAQGETENRQNGQVQSDVSKENLAKAAEGVDKIILVVGDEAKGTSYATVSYYERGYGPGNEWQEIFSVEGIYGRNGSSYDKQEGDGKTPCGTYHFTMAFGIQPDPGSKLPYTQLTSQDYWVDDPASPYYNQFVNTLVTAKNWSSAEHLIGGSPEYNYVLALNYNQAAVPGLGSAIFLHCYRDVADSGSAGCIRIPQEYMVKLIQSVDDKTRIVIVSDISHLEPRTLIPERYGRYL